MTARHRDGAAADARAAARDRRPAGAARACRWLGNTLQIDKPRMHQQVEALGAGATAPYFTLLRSAASASW